MTTDKNQIREDYEIAFWELFKDVHGFRPRHIKTSDWSLSELIAEVDNLHKQATDLANLEKQQEQRNIKEFENVVSTLVSSGAKSRTVAIRWLCAEATLGEEEVEYNFGLPFGYIAMSLKKAA